MKTMKKMIAILLALTAIFALTACGGGEDGGKSTDGAAADPIAAVAQVYSLNLTSTDVQEMSAERADCAALSAVVHDFLKDTTYFAFDETLGALTYDDLKEQIGVDASNYYFEPFASSTEEGRNVFTWLASDNSTAKFAAWFEDGKLYATGSSNVG